MNSFHEFAPKLISCLRSNYRFSTFRKDLIAGVTVGIIALPLAMAFAIASGVAPEKGLFTAIIAGFFISAFGGSRGQIGGPTGAFVVIVYEIVQRSGYEGLALATLIASAILIFLGLFRIGSWIKYVPHPLVTGFTTGIALIIFSSQIKDFFGLQMSTPPADFILKWSSYFQAFSTFDPSTLAVGAGTLALILFLRRFAPFLPWGVVAIVIATSTTTLFQIPVQTVFTQFGEIPRSLPIPSLPSLHISIDQFPALIIDAITIAFLGGIESLLSAVIADGMMGTRHKSNCELVGQGIANFASVLFGGIPATGAIARTAANVKSGAQTPIAGMVHAVTLFAIILFLAPIVSLIPLASLAAVLLMVAWNMSEVSLFLNILRGPGSDKAILLISFFLTVFVDITAAILFGMILASLLFMKKMSEISKTVHLTALFQEETQESPEATDPDAIQKKTVPPHTEVYEIQGPFFFGAAHILQDLLNERQAPPKVFILRMRHVPFIDGSGARALEEFHKKCHKQKTTLLLSGVGDSIRLQLKQFGLTHLIGEENFLPNIDKALARAGALVR